MPSASGSSTGIDHRFPVKRLLIAMAILLFAISGHASAMEIEEIIESQADAVDVEMLERIAGEYAPDFNWSSGADLDQGLAELLETGTQSINGIVKKALRSGVIIFVIVMFSSVASGMEPSTDRGVQAVPIAAVLAITAVSIADSNSLIGLGGETIDKMNAFSQVLLPAVAAVTVAAGAPAGAAARQMATVLFSDVLIYIIDHLLLPLVYAYMAVVAVAALIDNDGLKRIATTLKWSVTTILTVILLAFVGYLTVSGVIAGTTDAITLKATKFTMSSMVPVVGGILSDAAETVLAGAGILKNSIGVFGMLVILGMCIVPFLQLGVHYLMYKMTAALSSTVAQPRIVSLIDGLGGGFGLVLGMTGASALLMLIAMISAIKLTAL